MRDYLADSIVYIPWSANDADGASVNPAAYGTIKVYKNNSETERTSANGITVLEPHDAHVGTFMITIDLSDNSDVGFYAAGDYYFVKKITMTIDGQTVNDWIYKFSIEASIQAAIYALLKVGGTGDLTAVKKLLRADKAVDTTASPWVTDYKEEGTENVLMSKTMQNTGGVDISSNNNVLGRLVQE